MVRIVYQDERRTGEEAEQSSSDAMKGYAKWNEQRDENE